MADCHTIGNPGLAPKPPLLKAFLSRTQITTIVRLSPQLLVAFVGDDGLFLARSELR